MADANIFSCVDPKLIKEMILKSEAFTFLQKDPFVYSAMLGATRLTEMVSFLFEGKHAEPTLYKTFFLFLVCGRKIMELYSLLEGLNEDFRFWASALKSPVGFCYYSLACKRDKAKLKVGPVYYIQKKPLWFVFSKNSFRSQIHQKKMEIFIQISALMNFQWMAALKGDEKYISEILPQLTYQKSLLESPISLTTFRKPNLILRTWPMALLVFASCASIGHLIAVMNVEWWLDKFVQLKETLISASIKWIISPLKDMWAMIRYKTRKFGIESSLSSDAEAGGIFNS